MKIFVLAFLLVSFTHAFIRLDSVLMNAPTFKGESNKAVSNIQWTDCDGTGTPYVTLLTLTVTGSFQVGTNVEIKGTQNVKQQYTVSSVDATALLNGVKFYSGNIPLSQPVSYLPGQQKLDVIEPLTIPIPNGSYKVTAKLRNPKGQELQCFFFTFTVA